MMPRFNADAVVKLCIPALTPVAKLKDFLGTDITKRQDLLQRERDQPKRDKQSIKVPKQVEEKELKFGDKQPQKKGMFSNFFYTLPNEFIDRAFRPVAEIETLLGQVKYFNDLMKKQHPSPA